MIVDLKINIPHTGLWHHQIFSAVF